MPSIQKIALDKMNDKDNKISTKRNRINKSKKINTTKGSNLKRKRGAWLIAKNNTNSKK